MACGGSRAIGAHLRPPRFPVQPAPAGDEVRHGVRGSLETSLTQGTPFLTAPQEPRLLGDRCGYKSQNPRWTVLRPLGEAWVMDPEGLEGGIQGRA